MTRPFDDQPHGIANALSAPNGRARVVDLDDYRDAGAQLIVVLRRTLRGAQTRVVQLAGDPVEALLRQGPARTWSEAADRLRHLVEYFGQTREGQDHRQQTLVRRALRDIAHLTRQPTEQQ